MRNEWRRGGSFQGLLWLACLALAGVAISLAVSAYFKITAAVARAGVPPLSLWGHVAVLGVALLTGVVFTLLGVALLAWAVYLLHCLGLVVSRWRPRDPDDADG
jgi:hypothetical protein